ncbi:MAG: bifunctional nuclease domain-containing protein [Cyclobacteriaceae bacterium]
MDKIRLEILGLSSSPSQTGSFALVLGEEKGDRRLPIIIGMFEAQAIAIEIENIKPNRPMTHDLFRTVAGEFNIGVEEIVISDLKEGVFFASILFNNGKTVSSVDARPSDAIAIGLRFGAPIYTNENVLGEAGIILTSEEEEAELGLSSVEKSEKREEVTPIKRTRKVKELGDMSAQELNDMLDDAINNEQYERAAKIRDELDRRN